MSTYRSQTRVLAAQSEATALKSWGAGMPRSVFIAHAATAVSTFNRKSAALAHLSLAQSLTVRKRSVVLPAGWEPPDDRERLSTALATLLRDQDDRDLGDQFDSNTADRLGRLAYAEPLTAGRTAYTQAMQARGVDRWERVTGAAACELCTSWAADGPFPASVVMLDHPGCSCVAEPIGTAP